MKLKRNHLVHFSKQNHVFILTISDHPKPTSQEDSMLSSLVSKQAMQIKAHQWLIFQKGKSRNPAISFSCRAMMLFFGHFLSSSVSIN